MILERRAAGGSVKTARSWAVLTSVVFLLFIVAVNAWLLLLESKSSDVGPAFVTVLFLGLPWVIALGPLLDQLPEAPVWAIWLSLIAPNLINWGLITFALLRVTRRTHGVPAD